MDFFNSLTLDLKLLAVGIAGCALLALFSGNQNTEKRYVLALAVLAAVGVWRFMHVPHNDATEASAEPANTARVVKEAPKHVPLVSTSAK